MIATIEIIIGKLKNPNQNQVRLFSMFLFLLFTYFHPGWIDSNHNKLNTRQEVLVRDSIKTPSIQCTKKRCQVTSGLWLCPYTNRLYTNPKLLDIDHVVPLKEAYQSGANKWTRQAFIQFTNDPDNLLVVSARENRVKGDKEPARWPSMKIQEGSDYWCNEYLEKYIKIKQKYHLRIDGNDTCMLKTH